MLSRISFLPFLILLAMPYRPNPAIGGLPVKLQRQGDQIDVLIGGEPFTTYYFGPELPKLYLHPLRSAQGAIITREFPNDRESQGPGRKLLTVDC